MKRRLIALLIIVACDGCAGTPRLPPPSQMVPPLASPQRPHEDFSIQYNPDVSRPGTPRADVETVLGPPNATQAMADGQIDAIYAFFPDGGKFVNPDPTSQIAASFFTHRGPIAAAPNQLDLDQSELTFYHIRYRSDGTVMMVVGDRPKQEAMPAEF
ncbi:MAG TPA: hypothetical protein VJX23_12595 [Candidatus Binataceae bacterium]|nr:hypothetical protein [Candidatus Binataceae bacterium]